MKDIEFIKNFSKITLKKICELEGINPSNLLAGRCSLKKEHRIKARIEYEILKLYEEE